MVPHSKLSFDPPRHLARENIIFSDKEAIVLVKWSKTLQSRDQVTLVVISKLPGSQLCPVTALTKLLQVVLGSINDPLFAMLKVTIGFLSQIVWLGSISRGLAVITLARP